MSMRRHLLIAEHFRLVCLLLESREQAIHQRFHPQIKEMAKRFLHYNDREALKLKFGDRATQALATTVSSKKTNEEVDLAFDEIANLVIEMIWEADPNPKKAYTTWLLTRYVSSKRADDKLTLEDLTRTREYLVLFDRVKNRLPADKRDINRLRSTNELFDTIKNFRENEKGEIVTQDYEDRMYREAEVLYDGSDYEILTPKTKEASQYFGRGTEWCTAYAPPRTNNMFDHYNQKGPLYIIRDKSDGKRWQFHLDYVPPQYMDEADRSIDIHQFVKDHPVVAKVFDEYFGAEEWEQVAELASNAVVYFGAQGDGFSVRVSAPGVKFGGLVREKSSLTINTDANRVITSAAGDAMGTPEYETNLAEALNALKIKGNHEVLTDDDMVWTKDKGWGKIADVPPAHSVKAHGWTYSARKIEFGGERFHIYIDERGDDYDNESASDDVATIKAAGGEFTVREHKGYRWQEDHDMALAEIVLKCIPEHFSFNRGDSNTMMPGGILIEKRPRWVGIGELYQAKGDTEQLRERLADWLASQSPYKSREQFEWVGDELIVDRHKNIEALISAEGGDVIQTIMKTYNGDSGGYDFHDYAPEPEDWQKKDMLRKLEKSEPGLFKRLVAYLTSEFELELEDNEIELNDADDILELIEHVGDVGLDSAFSSAYADALASGSESAATEAMWDELRRHPHIMFRDGETWSNEPKWDVEVAIVANMKTILEYCTDMGDVEGNGLQEGGHGHFLKAFEEPLEAEEPRYGWHDHDDSVEAERFVEMVEEMLPDISSD
jgi:hypothetical protein